MLLHVYAMYQYYTQTNDFIQSVNNLFETHFVVVNHS